MSEVSDIEHAIADAFPDDDVRVWLVSAGDPYEQALAYLQEAGTTLPCLLDTDESLYRRYDRREGGEIHAPFPLQVVIDREGRITYLANQYDADAARAGIQAALAR
jgi:peroxiredoxin